MTQQQVGINGFGRFGLHLLRYWLNNPEAAAYQIRFINDDFITLDHAMDIMANDPYVPFSDVEVTSQGDRLHITRGDRHYEIQYTHDPLGKIAWMGEPDLVLECSGKATQVALCQPYLTGKTQRVVISATSWDADKTLVYGYNHGELSPADRVISYGSCTVNAYLPLAQYIHRTYGLLDSDVNVVHNVPTYKLDESQTLNRKFCTLEKSAKRLLPFIHDDNFIVNYTLVPYTGASQIDFRFRVDAPPTDRTALIETLKGAMASGALGTYGMVAVNRGPEEHILTPFSAVFIEENIKLLGNNLYIHAYFDTENSVNRYHDLVNYVAQATRSLDSVPAVV
jgi:glyceraldehyde 3-phosphate dehydrogenase